MEKYHFKFGVVLVLAIASLKKLLITKFYIYCDYLKTILVLSLAMTKNSRGPRHLTPASSLC